MLHALGSLSFITILFMFFQKCGFLSHLGLHFVGNKKKVFMGYPKGLVKSKCTNRGEAIFAKEDYLLPNKFKIEKQPVNI